MQTGFDPAHIPFWLTLYVVSVLGWTCVGRFLMSAFVAADSRNYIWRFFRLLTDPVLAAVRIITPLYVHAVFLPLAAMFWLYVARVAAFILFASAGMVPRVGPA